MALYDEEDDNNGQVEYLNSNAGGLGTGSNGTGASGVSAPQTAQPKADKQDRFVSFDRLFNANAGNAKASATNVANKVQGEVDQYNTALGGLSDRAYEGVMGGVVQNGDTWSYNGPNDLSEVAGYDNVFDEKADATDALDALGNRRSGGINALMGDSGGTGKSRLNSALVNKAGSERFDKLFSQYTGAGGVDQSLDAASGNAQQWIGTARNTVNECNGKPPEPDRDYSAPQRTQGESIYLGMNPAVLTPVHLNTGGTYRLAPPGEPPPKRRGIRVKVPW